MRSSAVHSTTRVTLSSLGLRTTPAAYGRLSGDMVTFTAHSAPSAARSYGSNEIMYLLIVHGVIWLGLPCHLCGVS